MLITATFDYRIELRDGELVPWLASPAPMLAISDVVAALPLFEGVRFGGRDAMKPCRPDAASARALAGVARETVVELQDVATGRPDLLIRLAALDGSLEVALWAGGAHLLRHRDTLLEQCVTAAVGIRHALRGVAGLRARSVVPSDPGGRFDYLRDRPPRRSLVFPLGSVVDLIDLHFHESGHVAALPDEARALAETPSDVARSEHDGLVVARWARGATEAELAEAASAHDAWAQRRIPTERMPRWNDLGDQQEVKGTTQPRPPLTLYGVKSKVGYKAVMVSPEGELEPTALAEAKAVLERGALADGAPVTTVKLVVPLREQAVALADGARAAGFGAVLYAADDDTLWNPKPPGLWREHPPE